MKHIGESISGQADHEFHPEVRVGGSLAVADFVPLVVVVDYGKAITDFRLVNPARHQVCSVR